MEPRIDDAAQQQTPPLAHDLNNATILRSKDVELTENVKFVDLLLSQETNRGLQLCGFERPSPIQLATIPLGRCGFDLVVQSKAGTGKTCIFALVALESLQSNPNNCTQTLIIAPTREVATQIHEVICRIGCAYKQLNCGLFIGGVEVKQDRKVLSKACQIIIGTPGRIKQLIELNLIKTQQMELLVLDEADKLVDEQFKNQIDAIYKRLPFDKQMIVTSATYPNELSSFLQNYMRAPVSVRLGVELCLEGVQEFFVESKAGNSMKRNIDNKLDTLKALIDQEMFVKCFVFTNYQDRARTICKNLNKDDNFIKRHGQVHYICAELTQTERNNVFNNFRRSSQNKILVSTDISARGIDIHDVEVVINFDLPTDNATYYHRIGRAGRFGKSGRAISIVANETTDKAIFHKCFDLEKIKKLMLQET